MLRSTADEASDAGSEAGVDADYNTAADKDGLPHTTTISSNLRILTSKVQLLSFSELVRLNTDYVSSSNYIFGLVVELQRKLVLPSL